MQDGNRRQPRWPRESGPSNSAGDTAPARRGGHAAFLLSQLGAHAAALFAQRLEPLGLDPAHAGVLRLIASDPELNQRALASRLQTVPSRVVTLVDELEHLGLVKRERRAQDRRSHALRLTQQGIDMIAALRKVADGHQAELLHVLTEDEQLTLAVLLQRLADAHDLPGRVHPGFRPEHRPN